MNIKNFIKTKLGEILMLSLMPLTFYYLIPFPYFFIAIIISYVGSFIGMYYIYKETNKNQMLFSSKGFLMSFYSLINQETPIKVAYEVSTKFLNSYYSIKPYEEICDNPDSYMFTDTTFFSYVINKDKQNEGLIPNYSMLFDQSVKEYDDLNLLHLKNEKKHNLVSLTLVFGFFALAFIFCLMPNIKNALNSMSYLITSILMCSISFPLNQFDYLLKLKEENKDEK